MIFLAIDTTKNNLCVVLRNGERVFSRTVDTATHGHSAILIPTIEAVVNDAAIDKKTIEYYSAVVGPGSFTGIRIGVAAMTALSYALNAKRVAVNSFELIAYNRDEVTAVVDAGHGNTYCAKCRKGKVEDTTFVAAGEPMAFENVVDCPQDDEASVLDAVVKSKIENGETVAVFEPFYMRKSQAERNIE